MINLLEETKRDIEDAGYKTENIVFIGSQETGHQCTWNEFCVLADKEYGDGFGSQNVASDLIIVFDDGAFMRRAEYDGAEWWEFKRPFVPPKEKKKIKTLFPGMWRKLYEAEENKR